MSSPYFFDMIQENGTSPGTGAVSLSGAVSGFLAFSVGFADQATPCYKIEDATDPTIWEIGIGLYTLSGTTLARTTVKINYLGTTAKVNFANAVKVRCVLSSSYIGSMTGRLVDLSSYKTVIDDDFHLSPILVPDTSKPVAPQYTKTILSGNFPSCIDILDYCAIITIGGRNNNGSSQTFNTILTVNGVEKTTTSTFTCGATQYWYVTYFYRSAALAINDAIGVKMWCGTTNVVDYRYASIYLFPRTLAAANTRDSLVNLDLDSTTFYQANGAISGTTYSITGMASTPVFRYFNPTVNANSQQLATSGNNFQTFPKGCPIICCGGVTDAAMATNGAAGVPTLNAINNIPHYITVSEINQ